MRVLCLFIGILVILATSVQAITFDQIFFAGDGRDGKLGGARSQFAPDDSRIYLRFIYRDGQPGQKLIAYWQILEDVQGRSGQFATSEMTLEKSADRGQFSFNAEEPWAIGQYRVTITDSNNIIVEEMDFQVVSEKSQAAPKTGQNSQFEVQDEELPPSFLEQYRPDQGELVVSKVFSVGREESVQFKNSEPTIYIRFEYSGASPNQTVDAVWDHLGENSQGGIGIFARAQVKLERSSGRAQFSFRPKPAGSWLGGDYRVVLLNNQKIIGQTEFTIGSTTRKAVRYDEIVTAISSRLGARQDAVEALYRQQPALFSNIRGTLNSIAEIEQFVQQSLETLLKDVSWLRKQQVHPYLREFGDALRSYRVSIELLPKNVKTASLPDNLANSYGRLRNDLPSIKAYQEALAQAGNFGGHTKLYSQLLSAKGESAQSVSKELGRYLQGKADLYWRNRLEANYQLSRARSSREAIVDALWQQRANDVQRIKDAISK